MTTSYSNTNTLQSYAACPNCGLPATAADLAFAQTQNTNQTLAEQVGNFRLFGPNGLVDGARTNQAMNEVRNTVVYLTASVISTAGASPAIWNTGMIDWTATLSARQAYRTAHFGF